MKQLMMYWKAVPSQYPANSRPLRYRTYNGSAEDVKAWMEICRNGLLSAKDTEEIFKICMLNRPDFSPDSLFFVQENTRIIATVAVLFDAQKKQGIVHMVGVRPDCRGRGISVLLNQIAQARIWQLGCTHAFLTTDDFRVAAIRSYLKAGFLPVQYDEGMEERWSGILNFIGYTNVPFVDEQGAVLKTLNEI